MSCAEKVEVSWMDVRKALTKICHAMHEVNFRPERIIGITRGGLVPAVMLSHMLNVPHVDIIRIQLRDNPSLDPIIQGVLDKSPGRYDLIIDDLWDSGATFKAIKEVCPKVRTAALYYKSLSAFALVDWMGFEKRPDQWIVFPWEVQS